MRGLLISGVSGPGWLAAGIGPGWLAAAFLFALLTMVIISGHLIFAHVSDQSISLKHAMNSWQDQAQIGVSE